MKNKKYILYIAMIIVIEIIKYCLILDGLKDYKTARVEVKYNASANVNYEYLKIQEGYELLKPEVLSRQEELLRAGDNKVNVQAIATNEFYADLENMRLISGSYFNETMIEEGRNNIIISDELAYALYGSKLAAGNTCKLGNTYYQITGVYKAYDSLKDRVIDDGISEVYIPITSTMAANWNIESIVIGVPHGEKFSLDELKKLKIDKNNAYINDQTDLKKKLLNLINIPAVYAGILLVVGMFRKIRPIEKMAEEMKKSDTRQFMKPIGTLLLGCIVAIGIYKLAAVRFYISKEMLPQNNLFDISYYIRYLSTFSQKCNYYGNNVIKSLMPIYYYMIQIIWGMNLVQIIVFRKIFK